jgi:hypothetical protein
MTLLRHVSPQYTHYERTVSENSVNGNSDHFANQFCSWLAREGKIEDEKALPQRYRSMSSWPNRSCLCFSALSIWNESHNLFGTLDFIATELSWILRRPNSSRCLVWLLTMYWTKYHCPLSKGSVCHRINACK